MKEIWKDIDGYEGLYQVSNLGRIKSFYKNSETIKKTFLRSRYCTVTLYKDKKQKTFTLHRIVAKAFIKNNLSKPCINHIDGDRCNNKASNLEWCTHSENTKHAYDNNLITLGYGTKHHLSKLNRCDVLIIKKLLEKGMFDREIAEKFKVSRKTISRIRNKKTYLDVV